MIATDRLHEYVQRNAPHWYQFINGYADYAFHPNGSLVIVTGWRQNYRLRKRIFLQYGEEITQNRFAVYLEAGLRPAMGVLWPCRHTLVSGPRRTKS